MRIRLLFAMLLICAIIMPSVTMAQKDKSSWLPNPTPSKYFIGSTAIPMEKHTGYYQNSYVLFNEVYYGFTDWFSMGVGCEFLSTFITMANPPFRPILIANPKFGFKVADKLYASVSGLYVNATLADDEDTSEKEGTFGLLMGQVTYGTIENNITAGLAWGYSWDGIAEKPVFTLGGTYRTTKRMSLAMENYIVPMDEGEYYWVCLYGMRFLGEKMNFDLGFFDSKDLVQFDIVGIPYIGVTINF